MQKKMMALLLCAALTLCTGSGYAAGTPAFSDAGFDNMTGTRYKVLEGVQMNGLTFTRASENYEVKDAKETVLWQTGFIRKDEYQKTLMPASVEDVKRDNVLRARLGDWPCFDGRMEVTLNTSGTLPVYAAPSEDAYRGAAGKAAVSLKEGFTLLADTADGAWWLIEYDVSKTEKRVGYIARPQGVQIAAVGLTQTPVTVTLNRDEAMTDDPNGAHRAIMTLKKGANVTSLGWMNAYYAYVETTIDQKPARGFVPLSALDAPEETDLEVVKARLAGTWRFIGGGELLGLGGVIFDTDGLMTPCDSADDETFPPEKLIPADEHVRYRVYAYDPSELRYWAQTAYVLALYGDDGMITRYGLAFGSEDGVDTITVTHGEAGGSYERYFQ